jgi:hypothetical protein
LGLRLIFWLLWRCQCRVAANPQTDSQADCGNGARETNFHLNLQLLRPGEKAGLPSGGRAIFGGPLYLFSGAAPEAPALQFHVTHRFDALFTVEVALNLRKLVR